LDEINSGNKVDFDIVEDNGGMGYTETSEKIIKRAKIL